MQEILKEKKSTLRSAIDRVMPVSAVIMRHPDGFRVFLDGYDCAMFITRNIAERKGLIYSKDTECIETPSSVPIRAELEKVKIDFDIRYLKIAEQGV